MRARTSRPRLASLFVWFVWFVAGAQRRSGIGRRLGGAPPGAGIGGPLVRRLGGLGARLRRSEAERARQARHLGLQRLGREVLRELRLVEQAFEIGVQVLGVVALGLGPD